MPLSRRDLMLGTLAGVTLGRGAHAQSAEQPAIVLIYLDGGYHALFSAADGYAARQRYGCSASTVRELGNSLVVDASTLGTLPDPVLSHMATVGVAHGASGHDFAQRYAWYDGLNSVPLMLADALGGSAPFRCVHFAEAPGRGSPHRAYNQVAMTAVPDLAVAATLFSSSSVPAAASRKLMARSLRTSLAYSNTRFTKSPNTLSTLWEGTHGLINSLERPVVGVDWAEIGAAYGIAPTDFSARNVKNQLAGAELMLRAGADVVCISSLTVKLGLNNEDWDTHEDQFGQLPRDMMRSEVLPGLRVFLERTLAMTGRNVVTLLYGDFARIGGNGAGDSGHANGLSATVFGKYVQNGTTGRFSSGTGSETFYTLPPATPGYRGLWALLTAAARAPRSPWGANPHAGLLRA